jgi:ABC-type branched-subunit amino acid transport system ATPase component/ABC-type branched-subunit amino acid transport system permease subunit
LATKWFGTGLLAGLAPSLPFIVLFVVLLVFPKRRLLGKTFSVAQSRPSWQAPGSAHLISGAIGIVFLIYVPYFAGIHLTDWTTALALTVVFLGLGMLVRTSGQVSLCHVGFMAIGAATFSHLSVGAGLPWLVALLLAGLVTVPIGALLAIPAIRLSGLYLALATLGFGLLLQSMFYTQDYMFGDSNAGLEMPRPDLFGMSFESDINFYYLALGLSIVAAVVTVIFHRGRLGRLLRGLSDSPTALETSGASVTVTKVIVFCLSAFFAAIGGALAGVSQGSISASSYSPMLSLTFFALILISVGSEPWYAILAGFGWAVLPSYISGENVDTILQVIFGVSAILIAITARSGDKLPHAVRTAIDTIFGKLTLHRLLRRTTPATSETAVPTPPVEPGVLQVDQMTITFGGVTAVDALTLRAETGTVTGLIGPNGAGKTTTFNGCTGLLRPSSGTVTLNNRNVTGRGPATRAQLGLGRTFQKMELFESLTVRENVAIGAEGSRAGFNPWNHLLSTPAANTAIAAATDDALQLCGIAHLADNSIAALSTGHRRLVELARCLAGPFQILLLDEPSSGLDAAETKQFGDVLKHVVTQRNVGILLVEHDMSLVLDICDTIYVLDFGELIFTGTPTDITTSPIVQAAYLGDDLPTTTNPNTTTTTTTTTGTTQPTTTTVAVEEHA